jgi:hypothetical protein
VAEPNWLMLSEERPPALSQVTNMMKVSPAAALKVPSVCATPYTAR